MASGSDTGRRRVFVPHALGADEFLRATWHPGRGVMVVSHWRGAECVAATPVRVGDLDELAELVAAAASSNETHVWPSPRADDLVIPADGFAIAAPRRTA